MNRSCHTAWLFIRMPLVISRAYVTGTLTDKWDPPKVHRPSEFMYPFAMLAFRSAWGTRLYQWINREAIREQLSKKEAS